MGFQPPIEMAQLLLETSSKGTIQHVETEREREPERERERESESSSSKPQTPSAGIRDGSPWRVLTGRIDSNIAGMFEAF